MGFLTSIRVRLSLLNAGVILLLFIILGSVLVGIAENQIMGEIDRGLVERARRLLGPPNGQGPNGQPGQGGPGQGGQGGQPGGGPNGGRQQRQDQPIGQTAQFRPNRQPGGPGQGNGIPRGEFDDPEAQKLAEIRSPRVIQMDGQVAGPAGITEPWDKAAFNVARNKGLDLRTIVREETQLRLASVRVGRPEYGQVVVQVARELDDIAIVRSRLIMSLLILLPFALAASVGIGLFLMGRAMKPVADMTNAAAEMGEQDLSRRLPVTSKDEFGSLAATFNGLFERLDAAFASRAAAYQKLEHLYEQQKRMTADASHELRTPLTRIKLVASASLAQDETAAEYKEALETIDSTADDMSSLVQQMLDLARAESGVVAREPFLPYRSALAAWKSLGSPERVKLNVPDDLHAIGSGHALQQILRNLIENALRHSDEDKPVVVSAEEDATGWTFKVVDQGEGIEEEHLPHLTERFYRAHPDRARESGGTGLGLSICSALAQSMGGKLTFQSQIGRGTTATVKIPKNFSNI